MSIKGVLVCKAAGVVRDGRVINVGNQLNYITSDPCVWFVSWMDDYIHVNWDNKGIDQLSPVRLCRYV
jgi:hypothetical protein